MNKLHLLGTQYTPKYKSLEIIVAGCKDHPCKGCFNPESWNFNQGTEYDTNYFLNIKKKVEDFPTLVKNIFIIGGEPVDSDLGELLFELSTLKLPIWLFTHYELEDVPQYIKNYCDNIKTGMYIEDLKVKDYVCNGITLATSNQSIHLKAIDY